MDTIVRTLALTAWVEELGIRVTLYSDHVFRTLRGFEPSFDPTTVHFVTDRTVGNLAAHHGIRISGDTISVARLSAALDASTNGKDRRFTLEEMLEHKYLGKNVDGNKILEAYGIEDLNAVAA